MDWHSGRGPAGAAEGEPIPGIDVKLGKNPGGAIVTVGDQTLIFGATVAEPDLHVRVDDGAEPAVVAVIGRPGDELLRSIELDAVSVTWWREVERL